MADQESPGSMMQPSWKNFNAVFLGYSVVTGVIAVFFLLYFNRVVASILSSVIRTYTWHRYRIYIDIRAVQLSLLGGRLFFTGLRYHGANETIIIQNGHVTWSYWLRRVRHADVYHSRQAERTGEDAASGARDARQKLPCRIKIAVSGLEWFVYNRSAAYDSISNAMASAMDEHLPHRRHDDKESRSSDNDYAGEDGLARGPTQPRHRSRKSFRETDSHVDEMKVKVSLDSNEKDTSETRYPHAPSSISSSASSATLEGRDALPLMLQLYPIHFECDKGAMVMGNAATKSLLIVKTKSLSGDIDATQCQTVDPYRQLFEINFNHPVLEVVEHDGYKEDQLARAAREKQAASDRGEDIHHRSFFRRQRRRALGQLRNLVPYWRKSVESFSLDSRSGIAPAEQPIPGFTQWQGLSRYLNGDDEDDKSRWSSLDYAAVNTVVDSPEGTLKIYWDVPSKVLKSTKSRLAPVDTNDSDYINGDVPPAWAISLALKGGVINYGPWADRQRAELQRVFFPGLCKDSVPASQLPVGSDRVPTIFNFYLELSDEATLKIPTREDSKNWRWKKEALSMKRQRESNQQAGQGRGRNRKNAAATAAEQRPNGWIDIKIGTNATVSYSMDMLPGPTGYHNTLKIDLPSTEVSTSVNHGVLWRSGVQRISCDLSTPLKWNGLRNWRFDIDSDGMELFILREHTFLIIDLIDDWASGPPSEYLLFTPFKYFLNLSLRNLKLYINVNDANIINDPTSMDENAFLILSSPCLKLDTRINLDTFHPSTNVVPFKIETEVLGLGLHAPLSNTQATFLASKDAGSLEKLVVDGNYHYNTTTSSANTDTLVLDVTAQSPMFYLYGFLIRYFLLLKDNYFGDHVHFRTLDEYQHGLRVDAQGSHAEVANRPPPKKSNDLDVMLTIRTDDPKIILPGNLYSARRHIVIEATSLAVDLRFTNYYMDLDLSLTPLCLSLGDEEGGAASPTSFTSKTQLFIDGIAVYGHRLFGLPPSEPTYLCNWDLNIGAITGECSAEFLTALVQGGKAFGFSLDDDENALLPPPIVYDVTFLRVYAESFHVWLHIEESAFLYSSGPVQVNYNDWARTHYSRRVDISIPHLEFSCIQSESAARHSLRAKANIEADLFFRTDFHFALVGRKYDFENVRRLQQELVRRHDQRTHRTDFLLLPGVLDNLLPDSVEPVAQSIPAVPPPVLPATVTSDKRSASSFNSIHGSTRLRRKSSFLSFTSSNEARSTRRGSIEGRKGPVSAEHSFTLGPLRTPRSDPKKHAPDYSQSPPNRRLLFGERQGGTSGSDPIRRAEAPTSQFFAPYFPLEAIQFNMSDEITRGSENDKKQRDSPGSDFGLDDVDPTQFPQDRSHQSFLFDFPSGISLILNTASLRCVAALIRSFQPAQPEDLLDALQIGSVSDIFALQAQENIGGAVTDVILRLPHAHARFLNNSYVDDCSPHQQDQYDLSLVDVAFAIRSERSGGKANPTQLPNESLPSFHLQLATITLTASEKLADLGKSQAAAFLEVDRVMASMGSKEINYLDTDIGAVRMRSSLGRIQYLASLTRRSNLLLSEMGSLFSALSSVADERLKYFTHVLTVEGQRAGDPSFVVRPSAVLRAASSHLRTYDSWKMVARLRYIWTTLAIRSQVNIIHDCLSGSMRAPEDVRERVVIAFDHWRSWDLDDTGHAVLLNNIFGKGLDNSSSAGQVPWMAVGRVHELRLSLDPGPKSNQILVLDLTARVSSRHYSGEDDINVSTTTQDPPTIVNLYCTEVSVNLNWELTELVAQLPSLYSSEGPQSSADDRQADQKATIHSQPPQQQLHFVFAMGRGSMSLDTIHLTVSPRCENFKLSLVNGHRGLGATETNVALNCDTAAVDILSHSQELVASRLNKPSVIITHESLSPAKSLGHAIRAAASSQRLDITILQDPSVLAEVADLLIIDEATSLRELQKQWIRPSSMPATKQQVADAPSSLHLNVAMFLDSYTITVPLLHSLTYIITGTVSRSTVAADVGKHFTLDFDVKENSHEMQVRLANTSKSVSLLQIPPMNGRIISQNTPEDRSIEVFASLELVELDASAIYSLLTTLNRPEISNAINELQQQGKTVQSHLQDLIGPSTLPSQASKSDDSSLIYNIHATLAGVKISGNAPIQSDPERFALLAFFLDRIHLEVANKVDHSVVLDSPEVHVNVRKIGFDIMKGCDDDTRSCGNLAFGALITASTRELEDGQVLRAFDFMSDGFSVNLSPDTVSTFLDVLGHMRDKFKKLDTSRELEYLRKLRQSRPRIAISDELPETGSDILDSFLASVMYTFQIRNIQIGWLVTAKLEQPLTGQEDLYLSVKMIEFATRQNNAARLTIEDLQLQMVPSGGDKFQRSLNSALLPEMIFNVASVSTVDARRLAFQAVGKSLDLRLTSGFIVPAAHIKDSITLSINNVQRASQNWAPIGARDGSEDKPVKDTTESARSLFGRKRLESVLLDADFAGAEVHLSGRNPEREETDATGSKVGRHSLAGKYGQFSAEGAGSSAELRTPGLAWKAEYRDDGKEVASLHGEIKIEPSRNMLLPTVVPFIMDISSSVKKVVGNTPSQPAATEKKPSPKPRSNDEENILSADPSAVLGRIKLNLGLRICKQEFTLSCQPIGRVAATARFDDIYMTVNTVHSTSHGNFFALSGTFSNIHLAVQHVYSRESTGSFDVDSIVLSLMNSKHVSGTSGLSAIVKMSPMKVAINARQVHDFLLFREIWIPSEVRQGSAAPVAEAIREPASQGHLVQRYQQVAATAAFPWTATISISALDVSVDLGQSLGKPEFAIKNFWVSSKKTSDWEQNLCLGFEEIGMNCDGRLSGFVTLHNFKLRTSIQWPEREQALNETPKIQASVGFSEFKLKVAFDYQAFLVADITTLEFLMYNVRQHKGPSGDRLVAIFDGEAVQVFGIVASAAQGAALWKAIQKFIQERKANYEASLREIEKYTKRRSVASQAVTETPRLTKSDTDEKATKSPISLDTDVVVTLRALNLGIFPNTFFDHQVFKLEALNAQARFAASMEEQRIHSILGLTLGQLRIGLAGVRAPEAPKSVKDIQVEQVARNATGSRGGTILKVPKVEAVMETWQRGKSRNIQYKFKSAFEGKVEVGWNYSRISYIRGMWAKHSKMLAQVWGRELPTMSAIKVTGVPEPAAEQQQERKDDGEQQKKQKQQKITAEVNVPQSKYEYEALEPPVIETPQLRDMGEATPPLEWIGLHRDRLPNLTHQIVIVALLELAGEVEDAYSKILGS
ncbi:hypothetical protein F5Y14DRAFT_452638 [Nemania sp. NC0429]|nr:hypothetical protein F5Y14DRAFT_452638 [Nemania sp. NC0429]